MGDIATTPAAHDDPDNLLPIDLRTRPVTRYASWTRRVVATFLDGALLTGVTFLAVGPIAAPPVLPLALPGADAPVASVDGTTWHDSAWIIGAVVVLVLLQAYAGATPGKRTVGISVVHRDTGRPVGLVTTVLRWLAHVLDGILYIGYLRPLWDKERRTFADGLLSTLVVQSRYPVPWTPGTARPGTDARTAPHSIPWWDRSAPRARAITAIATALSLLGVGLSFSSTTSVVSLSASATCTATRVAPNSEGLTGFGATLSLWGQGQDTRLGITRAAAPPPGSSSIEVDLAGSSDGYVSVEATVRRADGRTAWSTREDLGALTMMDPAPSQAASIAVPAAVLPDLGTGWTWEVRLLVDDAVVEACTGEAPVMG